MSCDLCAHLEARGHYPKGTVMHCPSCHATSHGRAELHCTACHRTFGGEVAFTAHQTDDGCKDPMLLKTRDGKRRFKVIERGDTLVWVKNEASGLERFGADRLTQERLEGEAKKNGRSPRTVASEVGYVRVSSYIRRPA